MANPELLPAVKQLVRRLRQYFLPHGDPPTSPSWMIPSPAGVVVTADNHPLNRAGRKFRWLLGDPQHELVLQFCIQNFESLRRTAVALKRVEALLDTSSPGNPHFRVIWESLLEAPWAYYLNIAHEIPLEDDGQHGRYFIGFTSEPIDRRLLADLLDAAGTQPSSPQEGKNRAVARHLSHQDMESLNRTEKAVLLIIKDQPEGRGITGKDILSKLKDNQITIEYSSLRRHILPKLKKNFGVINHRAAGGYMIS